MGWDWVTIILGLLLLYWGVRMFLNWRRTGHTSGLRPEATTTVVQGGTDGHDRPPARFGPPVAHDDRVSGKAIKRKL